MRSSRIFALALAIGGAGCNAILSIEEGTPQPADASTPGQAGSKAQGAGGSSTGGAAGSLGAGGAAGSTQASGGAAGSGAGQGGMSGSGGAGGLNGGDGSAGSLDAMTGVDGKAPSDGSSDVVDATIIKDAGTDVSSPIDAEAGPPCSVSIGYVSVAGAGAKTGCNVANAADSVAVALGVVTNGGTIRLAEGTYANQSIVMSRPIGLDGGYDGTFTIHDAVGHPTILKKSGAGAVLTLSGTMPASIIITNLSVQRDDADVGVLVTANAAPTIVGNLIFGGSGGGLDSVALRVDTGAAPTIRSNYIRAGTGASVSTGIDVKLSAGTFTIEQNRIEAGYSSYSTGAHLGGPSVLFRNNVVFGGTLGSQTHALELAGTPTIANNTLHGGTGDGSTGIWDQESNGGPVIVNNIILAPGVSFGTCIAMATVPRSVQNNLLFSCSHALYDNKGNNITGVDFVNALNGQDVPDGVCTPTVNCQHAKFAGNVSTTSAATSIFTNLSGADNQVSTMPDNDWHLATTDATITQGGHVATLSDCGTTESPVSCGPVSSDFDSVARTAPFSIGAYEK